MLPDYTISKRDMATTQNETGIKKAGGNSAGMQTIFF